MIQKGCPRYYAYGLVLGMAESSSTYTYGTTTHSLISIPIRNWSIHQKAKKEALDQNRFHDFNKRIKYLRNRKEHYKVL